MSCRDQFFSQICLIPSLLFCLSVKDEDIGLDDYLGSCEIDIDDLGLDGTPMRIEKSIDRKRGVLMFSKTASIIMEIKYTK